MVARPGGSGGLYRVAAFGVAFQVEFFRDADIDVLRVPCGERGPESIGRIGSVGIGHRPCEVSVVSIAAEFDPALRRPKRRRDYSWSETLSGRWGTWLSQSGLAENVIRGRINRACLRERQIQLELSEPDIQSILRQTNVMAQVVEPQVAVAQPSVCS